MSESKARNSQFSAHIFLIEADSKFEIDGFVIRLVDRLADSESSDSRRNRDDWLEQVVNERRRLQARGSGESPDSRRRSDFGGDVIGRSDDLCRGDFDNSFSSNPSPGISLTDSTAEPVSFRLSSQGVGSGEEM